jgi:hypothetical protein
MMATKLARPVFASLAAAFGFFPLFSQQYDDLEGLGGHGGLLRTPHGTVLKPIAPSRCGLWERQFYEQLSSVCSSHDRKDLELYCIRTPR